MIRAAAMLVLAFATGLGATAQAGAPPELIARGEYLARAGDCVVCHTNPGDRPFAGGLKMATPLGAIYTTNITPDRETGIGDDSLEDFDRAVRRGVAKDGHRLYPAMPYPSYARITDDDLRALYAFFMEGVPAVRHPNALSEIKPPLNMRWPLVVWDWLFSQPVGFARDEAHDERWNRGAYLVQGLGHCGSCHTPRGLFFQEKGLTEADGAYLSGGNLDGWYASSLRGERNGGLGGWSEADIVAFLKTGHNSHASAYGTMIDVVNNSSQFLTEADLGLIATYLKSLVPYERPSPAETVSDATNGARIYAQQCAACHLSDGRGRPPYIAPLADNSVMMDADPVSLVNVTLNGASRIVIGGMPDAYRMPQYGVLLSNQEIADVVNFMRASWGERPAPVTAGTVEKIREQTEPASDAVVILRMR